MLVLSRKKNQAIMLGDDIEVMITDIKGDTVKIGLRAPASVAIHRKEVYESILKENRDAAAVKPEDIDQAAGFI